MYGINRFVFLRSTTAIALLTLSTLPAFGMDLSDQEHRAQKHIVIIGGGMAGLTAAYDLQKDGFETTLYEGRDRLGGRVPTHHFDENTYFEEGGTSIDRKDGATRSLAANVGERLTPVMVHPKKVTVISQQKVQDAQRMTEGLKDLADKLSSLNKNMQWRKDSLCFHGHGKTDKKSMILRSKNGVQRLYCHICRHSLIFKKT